MADAVGVERIERTVQRDGIGRGQRAVSLATRRDDANRADAGGAVTERTPNLPGESGYRGLAARAGDCGDDARLARVDFGGDEGQRAPRIADASERDVAGQWRCRQPFGDDRDGAGGERRGYEMQAVGLAAGNRDEGVA